MDPKYYTAIFNHLKNRFVEYSLDIVDNNKFAFLLDQGDITNVYCINDEGNFETVPFNDKLSNSMISMNMYFLCGSDWLCSEEIKTLQQEESFYSSYLLSKYYSTIGLAEMASSYRNDALDLFIAKDEKNYVLLYYELLDELDKNSSLSFSLPKSFSESIDYGIVHSGTDAIFEREINNQNDMDLYIFQVNVSCDCIDVQYDHVINANSTGTLKITYHASPSVKGSFVKTISVLTNAQQKVIVIPIKITII